MKCRPIIQGRGRLLCTSTIAACFALTVVPHSQAGGQAEYLQLSRLKHAELAGGQHGGKKTSRKQAAKWR